MRCTGCGKRWWKPAKECPSCGELLREHQLARQLYAAEYMRQRAAVGADEATIRMGPVPTYTPGCAGCFLGLVLTTPSKCCCFEAAVVKCIDCLRVGNPYQPHVCLVESPEESAQKILHATMPAPLRRTASDEAWRRAGDLDQSQGPRAPKH
jgi:hypothetical protein